MSIVVQYALEDDQLPLPEQITAWAQLALSDNATGEVTFRFVDRDEMQAMNAQFRGKPSPTNVLSFPFEDCEEILGDIAICFPVVVAEAAEQNKTVQDHCAHLVIHGCLHLLGMDHEEEAEATIMEAEETRILAQLGIAAPYID
jgi:probable rRNA maturation factor